MYLLDWYLKRKIPKVIETYNYKVMHITDTPDVTFGFLKHIVRLVAPDVIVHTGDFVDNIKLQLSRKDIDIYERRFKQLLKVLRYTSVKQIIFCLGNHDDENIVKKYLNEYEEVCISETYQFENTVFSMSHYRDSCSTDSDICLFGHSYEYDLEHRDSQTMLNGLDCIFVIDATSGSISRIPYPNDTDYYRQRKFKFGF